MARARRLRPSVRSQVASFISRKGFPRAVAGIVHQNADRAAEVHGAADNSLRGAARQEIGLDEMGGDALRLAIAPRRFAGAGVDIDDRDIAAARREYQRDVAAEPRARTRHDSGDPASHIPTRCFSPRLGAAFEVETPNRTRSGFPRSFSLERPMEALSFADENASIHHCQAVT